MKKVIWIFVLLLAPKISHAHPVPFKGAISVMSWNQPFLNEVMTTYSFHKQAAIAAEYMRMDMKDGEMKLHMPQFNYLVHRWNQLDSQGNLYVSGGAGGYELNDRQKTAALGSIEADYETRKVYVSSKFTGIAPEIGSNVLQSTLRAGVAAYESEFEEIASWFIVEVQHNVQLEKTVHVTPMVRLFYKNVLVELGSSLDGDVMTNFMVHF